MVRGKYCQLFLFNHFGICRWSLTKSLEICEYNLVTILTLNPPSIHQGVFRLGTKLCDKLRRKSTFSIKVWTFYLWVRMFEIACPQRHFSIYKRAGTLPPIDAVTIVQTSMQCPLNGYFPRVPPPIIDFMYTLGAWVNGGAVYHVKSYCYVYRDYNVLLLKIHRIAYFISPPLRLFSYQHTVLPSTPHPRLIYCSIALDPPSLFIRGPKVSQTNIII